MTVESRLLISHLIMFIVPIFMTVIVAAVMPAGAPTLSRGNNYLYLEIYPSVRVPPKFPAITFSRQSGTSGKFRRPAADFPPVPKAESYSLHQRKNPIYIYGNKNYLPQAAGTAGYSHPHRQCQKR